MGDRTRITRGFTFIELLTTLAVAGVILAIATPNFRQFLLNSRMTGTANDLLASLQLARSEAIKRQQPIAVCPSQNPGAAPPTCRTNPVWSDAGAPTGLVLWVDTNSDATPGAGEPVLEPQNLMSSSLTVQSNFNVLTYLPTGFSEVPGNPAVRVILICDERADQRLGDNYRKRIVSINRTGRAEVLKSVAAVDPIEDEGFGDTGNCPET